jgi:hypothetical protein
MFWSFKRTPPQAPANGPITLTHLEFLDLSLRCKNVLKDRMLNHCAWFISSNLFHQVLIEPGRHPFNHIPLMVGIGKHVAFMLINYQLSFHAQRF